MARPSLLARWDDGLLARVLSALVLAPPVLGAIYLGPPYSNLLVLLAGAAMAWEWLRLCGGGKLQLAEYLVIGTVVLAVLCNIAGGQVLAGWAIIAGAMASVLSAGGRSSADGKSPLGPWLGFGIFYVTLPLLAFETLRAGDTAGRNLIFWLLAVVWSTDIGAFFAGRTIGGPKLLPSVSPKKTWAGLLGGMALAMLVGVGVGLGLGMANPVWLAVLAAVLAFVSQCGDFLESGFKRHFNKKDSSGLIPGHGGVLDRVDGVITAILALALLERIGHGPVLG